MKLFLAALVALICSFDRTCDARGGGGGGGGGHGGGGGMSRPAGGGAGNFDHSHSFNEPHNFTPNHYGDHSEHSNYHPEYGNHYENGSHNNYYNHSYNHAYDYGHNTHLNNYDIHRSGNYAGHGNYGNWYHGNWHGDWHHDWDHPGWYHRPIGWWTAGFVAGVALSDSPWSWGYWPYYNPYCGEPLVVNETTIDYSQPIALAASDSAEPANSDQAMTMFASARQSFYDQQYPAALDADEKALSLAPSDPVMNEFRGVSLFALKKYKEAAGVVYAVLSAGPGWDWATMNALYPNVGVYTAQLRALEDFVKANPDDAAAHFLLAYHYLVCSHSDAAARQLKEVVKLNSQDSLSAQLLEGLTEKEPPVPPQNAPSEKTAAKPIEAATLVGNWKASRSDGSNFDLSLTADGNFTWKFTQKGKTQQFAGPYTVADNLLILKQNGNPVMVGQVTSLADNKFNFKLPGENPSDPGLTFGK
jgi:tetratricopeptide (TPR) repeat protein